MSLSRGTAAAIVGFAVIPDQPHMMPPVEALVVQQADPPEVAVSGIERARRAQARGGRIEF
ncbi:hypothetical protein CSIV_14270 [Microbacterium sp. CSI-V]|uniref:hypothetical protein n=1 Tax=Microbacterium sp. CSI-V TaxID=1933777 RepID=UPI00097BDBDB|nr:hypothetical protein [Microbacterium sp. CSI-V]ONI62636.1 hypothetical protein CSIV_14270 [Microbacterium sp. CSI-V]